MAGLEELDSEVTALALRVDQRAGALNRRMQPPPPCAGQQGEEEHQAQEHEQSAEDRTAQVHAASMQPGRSAPSPECPRPPGASVQIPESLTTKAPRARREGEDRRIADTLR